MLTCVNLVSVTVTTTAQSPLLGSFCTFPAGGELLPGHESDCRPAAHVHEWGRRFLGPVTAAHQPETRHAWWDIPFIWTLTANVFSACLWDTMTLNTEIVFLQLHQPCRWQSLALRVVELITNCTACLYRFGLDWHEIRLKSSHFPSALLRLFCSRLSKTSEIPGTSRSDYFQARSQTEETSGEISFFCFWKTWSNALANRIRANSDSCSLFQGQGADVCRHLQHQMVPAVFHWQGESLSWGKGVRSSFSAC